VVDSLSRAATRSGRAAVKAREAADLRMVDALIGLLHAGMSVRTAAERVGVGYHQGSSTYPGRRSRRSGLA
jgi:hypothetical protein